MSLSPIDPDKRYRGPFSLEEIENAAGDFSEVLMRPAQSSSLGLSPDEKVLTTIGYRWACGCEALGAAGISNLKGCLWSPCKEHHAQGDWDGPAYGRLAEAGDEDTVVPRGVATLRPGEILVKRID